MHFNEALWGNFWHRSLAWIWYIFPWRAQNFSQLMQTARIKCTMFQLTRIASAQKPFRVQRWMICAQWGSHRIWIRENDGERTRCSVANAHKAQRNSCICAESNWCVECGVYQNEIVIVFFFARFEDDESEAEKTRNAINKTELCNHQVWKLLKKNKYCFVWCRLQCISKLDKLFAVHG